MSASGTESLSTPVRRDYERLFAADFSGVRVHTDAAAGQAASGIAATAFASGDDIYFAQGRFAPATNHGRELLAHELTHVLQQRAVPREPTGPLPSVSHPADAAELEADQLARTMGASAQADVISVAPSAAIQRNGPDSPVCERPPAVVGTFLLDPSITDVAIPTDMAAHMRISQDVGTGRGLFRDRYVDITRPVRSARRLTAFAIPRERVSAIEECTEELVSHALAEGDQALTPSGPVTVTRIEDDLVFTAQPNGDTVAAGAAILLETDAGSVLIDAGLQAADPQHRPPVGKELGRQIGELTRGEPIGEAIIATVTADGPALPFIATVVGLRSVRATPDLFDDGTVAAILAAQVEYRRWFEASLRQRLVAGRSEWESTQPIAPNQGIRDRVWEAHLESTVATALRDIPTPTIGTATNRGETVQADDAPGMEQVPVRAGEIPDVSGTQWEPVDDQRVVVYGGGYLAMVSSRGLVERPVGPTAPHTVVLPVPTAVPSLQPTGPLGLPAAAPRPVTPWMLLAAIGKESSIVVRSGPQHLFLVDAGGPRAITVEGMASLSARLGGGEIEKIFVTHEHHDHVRHLLELIANNQIAPDNLVISELWPDVIAALRETTDPRLLALTYGADWTGPRTVPVTGPASVIRARVRAGDLDVEILGLSGAQREHADAVAAERRGGRRAASSLADRASFLQIFGNESSPNRSLVLGDFRGENILELYNEMGEAPFRAALRNVRTVIGAGHHFSHAAGRRAADVRGLELLINATLIQNGELTIYVQSSTGFAFRGDAITMEGPEGALLRYFVRQGARLVFLGGGGDGGAVVATSAATTTFGTGAQLVAGDPRVVEMYRRLDLLREARRTVAESSEFGPTGLGLQGRSPAEILAGLDADIARLEGLARELSGHAGSDLLDVRGPQARGGRSRSRVRERQAYRESTTRPDRSADQILTEMATKGPAEEALTPAVLERLRQAVASGRSVAIDVAFAHTPTEIAEAIQGLPEAQRNALAQRYRELADMTARIEGNLVPPELRLDFLARAMALRNALEQAIAATTGAARGVLERDLGRVNEAVARLEAGTVRTVEVGRDIQGRQTRTEYVRLSPENLAVVRGFHGIGRAMGALMVVHSVSEVGTIIDAAARGDLTIPEGALRLAHAAYGVQIGVRLASTTFRQAMSGAGGVAMREFAILAVLEIAATAAGDYDDWQTRAAATFGTAIRSSVNLVCMALGAEIMGWATRLRHPLAVGVGMGFGLAVMMAGEPILRFFGLDEAVQRWTSFPPGEVTHVGQRIGAALREYRILIGTQQLAGRTDAEITGIGLSDPGQVRERAGSTAGSAAGRVRATERELTALFEDAYRVARGSFIGLQMLDQQAEDFTRLRGMAMTGRDDPDRADLDVRWRALDDRLDLSGADEAAIRHMDQWETIDDKLKDVADALRTSPIEFRPLFASMELLQLVMDNARYRLDAPTRHGTHGTMRPRSMIPVGTTAYRVYEEMLSTRETRLAALNSDLIRASGSPADSRLNNISADLETTLGRLRAIREAYDAQVMAAATENPTLALPATWDDPAVLARTAVSAYRDHYPTFQRLRLAEMTLQNAGRQAEIALTVATSPTPETLRRLARIEIDGIPDAINARRMTRGLVFPHELDTILEERGVQEDAILATRMDVAFPRGGVAPPPQVPPPTDEEILALRSDDLAPLGRRITTTERQLREVRGIVSPGRTWSPDEPLPSSSISDFRSGAAQERWDLMSRAIASREFALLDHSYQIVDFDWNDTYPERTVAPGRTPIVALLPGTEWGSTNEYGFGGPALFQRMIAVNADAIAQLGMEPVYVHGYRNLSNEEIDQRLGRPTTP